MTPPSPTLVPTMVPECPNGLFNFDEDCILVEDADEEIMELYMSLASSSPKKSTSPIDSTNGAANDSGGLGFLNSNESILEISIDLTPPPSSTISGRDDIYGSDKRGSKKKVKSASSNLQVKNGVESIDVKIQQDLGMLKGQKGDTGSILWRSSLYLATQLLRQSHHPNLSPGVKPIFDPDILKQSSILELGSGTGLLTILLSQLSAEYTSSDRLENLKLVKRNLELNGISTSSSRELPITSEGMSGKSKSVRNGIKEVKVKKSVNLEEIDWISISQERKRHPEYWSTTNGSNQHTVRDEGEAYDLIIAVDCIYNEYLVQPLIDTLSRYCKKGSGKGNMVWVVVELRSADVLTLFLENWLNDPSGPWTIMRLSENMMGDWDGKRARWVSWVGWR